MKLKSHDLRDLPQEAIDALEEARTVWNFGKYQPQVVTAIPTFTGRQGEFVILFQGNTGSFFWCTSDGGTTWAKII